jgi:hypothetical protein
MLILGLVLVWMRWTSTGGGRADIKQLSGDADSSRGTSFILRLETSQRGRPDAGYLSFHVQQDRNRQIDKGTSRHIRSFQDILENSPAAHSPSRFTLGLLCVRFSVQTHVLWARARQTQVTQMSQRRLKGIRSLCCSLLSYVLILFPIPSSILCFTVPLLSLYVLFLSLIMFDSP